MSRRLSPMTRQAARDGRCKPLCSAVFGACVTQVGSPLILLFALVTGGPH